MGDNEYGQLGIEKIDEEKVIVLKSFKIIESLKNYKICYIAAC